MPHLAFRRSSRRTRTKIARREEERYLCSKIGRFSTQERPVAKKPKKLEDLFHETLKDIYFAENKILKTLPKMAKAAQSGDLKAAFTKHERETREQVKRLERVFKIIGKPVKGKTCAAINGITEE